MHNHYVATVVRTAANDVDIVVAAAAAFNKKV